MQRAELWLSRDAERFRDFSGGFGCFLSPGLEAMPCRISQEWEAHRPAAVAGVRHPVLATPEELVECKFLKKRLGCGPVPLSLKIGISSIQRSLLSLILVVV